MIYSLLPDFLHFVAYEFSLFIKVEINVEIESCAHSSFDVRYGGVQKPGRPRRCLLVLIICNVIRARDPIQVEQRYDLCDVCSFADLSLDTDYQAA